MAAIESYSETHRDQVEESLAAEHNKVDLLERRNAGLRVVAYRAMKECVNTIYVEDEGAGTSCEFVVGDHEILTWFYHACAHRDYQMPEFIGEFDGA